MLMRSVLFLATVTSCTALQDAVVERQLGKAQEFLSDPGIALEPVAPGVWSFRHDWYRNLVLVSGDELAVVDPMSTEAAKLLAAELQQKLPGKRVTLVIYSHSHHDHIRGAAVFPEAYVVAHENVARELKLNPSNEVVPPKRTVSGDEAFSWAGMRIELLHLPRSHSDAYLAVWLNEPRILYAPDLVAKRGGLALENDAFLPGVIAGQERLLALDPKTIVPGHYALCTKEDLQRYHDMLVRMRAVTAEEIAKSGTHDAVKIETATFTRIQQRLRDEFGDVPGFNDALLFNTYYLVLADIGGF